MAKTKKISTVKIFLALFFMAAVVLPLLLMFTHIRDVNVMAMVSSPQFLSALGNSVLLAATATLASVALALLLSFSIARSKVRFKGVFKTLFTLPMLIPSISHGMGLVLLLGANGILTRLFNINGNIYGFVGVLIGSVMYSFPVAFLMLNDVLQYEDCSSYDAANVLGVPKFRQFIDITVPYLLKPMISVLFATFTLVITDYGVPLMVGGQFKTLPVVMYQEVIGLLNFGKGSVIGAVLLVPAVIAFLFDMFSKEKADAGFVYKSFDVRKNHVRDVLAFVLCSAVVLAVALPLVSFVLLSFIKKYPTDMSFSLDNISRAFTMGAGDFLRNSIVIALSVAVLGTLFAFTAAYLTARTKGVASRALHLASITSMAIPGLVLGLSYSLFFSGSFIYGTLAILILVNIMHFFSSPYLMAYNSFNKLNENLESVGNTMGIPRIYIIKDVFVPQMAGTLIEMLSYLFVNSMITISAVSFLYTIKTMPLSLMIPQFEAQMLLECSAFVSLAILIINLAVKAVAYFAKKRLGN